MPSESIGLIAAIGFLAGVIYFFSLGFERPGLGGKEPSIRFQIAESCIFGVFVMLILPATDWIGGRFGVTNIINRRMISRVAGLVLFGVGAVVWLAWRRSAKKRKRAAKAFGSENQSE